MGFTTAQLSGLQDVRNQLIQHPVYERVKTSSDLNTFMQHHVFAVWDFMSLLKSLQQNLTCVTLPWMPVGDPDTRFLINEIVCGEESDVDRNGNRMSHFEMYLQAMEQADAKAGNMLFFLEMLQRGKSIADSLSSAGLPETVQQFTNTTFKMIETGKPWVQAAVFTYGREDLIPDMFREMVKGVAQTEVGKYDDFLYYLERHIEVDGDHHSHLAIRMTEVLCGDDQSKWDEAYEAVIESLKSRILLWDGIVSELA